LPHFDDCRRSTDLDRRPEDRGRESGSGKEARGRFQRQAQIKWPRLTDDNTPTPVGSLRPHACRAFRSRHFSSSFCAPVQPAGVQPSVLAASSALSAWRGWQGEPRFDDLINLGAIRRLTQTVVRRSKRIMTGPPRVRWQNDDTARVIPPLSTTSVAIVLRHFVPLLSHDAFFYPDSKEAFAL
jgi:hypothetical protein